MISPPFHCDPCNVDLWFDHIRRRYIEDDGVAHHCPPPEIPNLNECICGVVVSVFVDGHRLNFKTGEPHSHDGLLETKKTAASAEPAPALWEAYRQ